MKLFILTLFFILLMNISASSHAVIKLRPYGTIGYTVTDTHYLDQIDSIDVRKLSWGFSVQAFYYLSKSIGVGLDTGYNQIWAYKQTVSGRTYKASISAVNISAVFEYSPSILVLQAGLGYYINTGSYYDALEDVGAGFGFMFAIGVEIPISKTISIPILAKIDMIFLDHWQNAYAEWGGNSVPFRLMTGVTIKFKT